MAVSVWPTKRMAVARLHLDAKNPRLGRESLARAPRDIIQYLFEHDKAGEVAESIATRGFFPNEPLLAVYEHHQYVVVEGNRRLAALKALREPGLLDGAKRKQVERLAHLIEDPKDFAFVPVTVAPSRRATDRQIAGRHIGTPVLAWEAENRASFILEKLQEGYDNDQLRDHLGFTIADIQKARQTRAIADMARSLPLPEEVKAKLFNPRANVFTTLGRLFDSSVGREFLMVEPDSEHGVHGTTTSAEFVKGFSKVVTDIALGHQSSRTLNDKDDIRKYFEKWDPKDLPTKKRGSFVPSDIITGKSIACSAQRAAAASKPKKSIQKTLTVLPKNLKIRFGDERLADIRRELVQLNRIKFPNAGAVLLRVFFELATLNYLKRTGELDVVIARLGGKDKMRFDVPKMKELVPSLIQVAKSKLSASHANIVEKAIRYDPSAPFTLNDLHAFVHRSSDPPGERDIWQFWIRTEPLFRLMLEEDDGDEKR